MKNQMKALFVLALILVFFVLILSACGGSSSSPDRLIVGEWRNQWGDTWAFQSGGRVQLREDGERVSGTFSISRDNTLDIVLVFPGWSDEMSFTWADSEDDIGRSEWFVTQERLFFDGDAFARR